MKTHKVFVTCDLCSARQQAEQERNQPADHSRQGWATAEVGGVRIDVCLNHRDEIQSAAARLDGYARVLQLSVEQLRELIKEGGLT